jgi:hypothetical protein
VNRQVSAAQAGPELVEQPSETTSSRLVLAAVPQQCGVQPLGTPVPSAWTR